MVLTPTFSVTPLEAFTSSYDSIKNEWKHYAYIHCFGVFIYCLHPLRLIDQYNQDKVVLSHSPVAAPAPVTITFNRFQHSLVHLWFQTNATTDNQYLLIYHVNSTTYGTKAAFYINGNLVRSEEVVGEQYISILVDCPPSQTWSCADMFLVGGGMLELKGIECYVL